MTKKQSEKGIKMARTSIKIVSFLLVSVLTLKNSESAEIQYGKKISAI